jgi:thiol-disulfide isomerase/thioredoxin
MPLEPLAAVPAIDVVVVEAPGCHLCDDAIRVLHEAAKDHPLSLRRVDLASAEGRAVVRRFRAPMPPVVTVDGELLGWGRLSRGKLRCRLEELARAGAIP